MRTAVGFTSWAFRYDSMVVSGMGQRDSWFVSDYKVTAFFLFTDGFSPFFVVTDTKLVHQWRAGSAGSGSGKGMVRDGRICNQVLIEV